MGNASQCCSKDPVERSVHCCTLGVDASDTLAKGGYGVSISEQQMAKGEVPGVSDAPAPGLHLGHDLDQAAAASAPGDGASPPEIPAGLAAEAREYRHVTYEDGSTYTGQVLEGKRQGHGHWKSSSGQYEGQWQADAQHGSGRQTWSDGRVYEGEFKFGKFMGVGKMVWTGPKGLMVYEGEYQDDYKHGTGKFVWADGRSYDGEWACGKRHGRGVYVNNHNETKVGYWLEDKFDHWEDG